MIAHSRAKRIEVSLSRQGREVVLCVRDNGVGIDKGDLKYIFERLYKCDRGRSQKGSGLGLAIVRQLVEKMEGRVFVESEVGEGTVFSVAFPLVVE